MWCGCRRAGSRGEGVAGGTWLVAREEEEEGGKRISHGDTGARGKRWQVARGTLNGKREEEEKQGGRWHVASGTRWKDEERGTWNVQRIRSGSCRRRL